MSFAQEVKQEIIARKIARPCCVLAASYGIACFSKYFDEHGVVLQTESQGTAQYAKRVFGMTGVLGEITEKARPSGCIYEFAIKEPQQVKAMLEGFGHTGREANLRINPGVLVCSGCVSAFTAAAFLCCGTITDPSKEYHLEFMSPRYNLSRDFEALLAEHEFRPHRTKRKGTNIVYLKASEPMEDLLTFMGASGAALEMMSRKVYKEIRNKTNRLNNCETANLDKTVTANVQTIKAIRYLEENGGLEALPGPLREAASKRMENPDLSLALLAQQFSPPLSKSGLSHRFKKIEQLAQRLQERKKNV